MFVVNFEGINLKGDFFSSEFNQVGITFLSCQELSPDREDCLSNEESNEYFRTTQVDLYIISGEQYIDFENLKSPLQVNSAVAGNPIHLTPFEL